MKLAFFLLLVCAQGAQIARMAPTDAPKDNVVDLVLAAMDNPINASCNAKTSKDFKTCADGYVSIDCVFSQRAATFGGVNCVPYLDACEKEMLAYCQSKVPASEKCKSTNACDCATETGCGWGGGYMMCLTGRPLVSCGDCPTLSKCGPIDCTKALSPCDCVALGSPCGWSTTTWRCESGKDTDCNECSLQLQCGGPGVSKNSSNCPAGIPTQLSACKEEMTCTYDKVCCERCLDGGVEICASTKAECDGKSWDITTPDLKCPDCEGYYYDYEGDFPTIPQNVTVATVTSTSATLRWKPPASNFVVGTDSYSVAYAMVTDESDLHILNLTTAATITLSDLRPSTDYKVSILPVLTATELVGEPAHSNFTTLAGVKRKAPPPTAKSTSAKAKSAAPTAKVSQTKASQAPTVGSVPTAKAAKGSEAPSAASAKTGKTSPTAAVRTVELPTASAAPTSKIAAIKPTQPPTAKAGKAVVVPASSEPTMAKVSVRKTEQPTAGKSAKAGKSAPTPA